MAKNPGGGEARSRREVVELFNETMATDNPDACSIAQDLLLEQNMTLIDVARANLPMGDGPYKGGGFVVDGYGPTDREWKQVTWTLAPTGRAPDFRVHWRIDIGKTIHLSPMPFLAARTVLGVQTRPKSEYLDVFPYPECEYRAVQFGWSIAKAMKRLGDRVKENDGEPILDALYNLGVDGHPFDYDDPFTPQQLYTGKHPSGSAIVNPASVRGIASARGTAENPGGQMSRATKTDAGVSPRALRMFRGFHKRDWRSAGDFSPDLVIPDRVHKLGNAKFVLYKSDKLNPETQEDEGWIDYIHEHDRGVIVCRADHQGRSNADVAVPAWLQKQTELVWLGDCNGFAYWDDDGTEREVKGTKPYPELYTVPSGKALLVIQNKRTLLAMFWGGRLGVEPRGIVH